MKNFVAVGDTVTVPAAAATESGAGVLVGALFGVAVNAAALGAPLQLMTTGIFDLPKTSAQAWTIGARVYWDAENSRVTTGASGNTLIGVAAAVAANPSPRGLVRLNGSF